MAKGKTILTDRHGECVFQITYALAPVERQMAYEA